MANAKFVQFNGRRMEAAMGSLEKYIFEKGIDIVLIQEPFTLSNRVLGSHHIIK